MFRLRFILRPFYDDDEDYSVGVETCCPKYIKNLVKFVEFDCYIIYHQQNCYHIMHSVFASPIRKLISSAD